MEVTSVIHSGLHVPPKFGSVLTRLPSISAHIRSNNWTRVRYFHNRIPIFTAGNPCRARKLPILFAKSTKEEDGIFTTSEYRTGKRPEDRSEVEKHESENFSSSVKTVAFWVFTAVVFGVGVGFKEGVGKASEFFAGYLLEQSLSVDNLFVFVLIFKYFKVPLKYQNRVLSYGIAGAVVFRLSIILLGTATLQRFEAVNLLFAAVLLYSSFKLFAEDEEEDDLSDNFLVKTCQKVIPVTANYDGNKFFTLEDGVRKVEEHSSAVRMSYRWLVAPKHWKTEWIIHQRLHLCFSRLQ